MRIAIVGPGATPDGGLPVDVLDDVARLERPGVEIEYRFAGGGPHAIGSPDDALAAAPFVAAAAIHAASDGFDAVVVDCTDDPGVAAARGELDIIVVGAGEALRRAIDAEDGPVVVWTGDALRRDGPDELSAALREGVTVALGGTGWSHVADTLRAAGHRVLDPLPLAVDWCVSRSG